MTVDLATATLIALLSLLAGASGAWHIAKAEYRRRELERRLGELEAEKERRNQLMTDSRGRERAHHSYNSLAAIEDATALLLDVGLDIEAIKARQETAVAILNVLRQGPGAYNPDKPNGGGR